jgi:hypothetical protein
MVGLGAVHRLWEVRNGVAHMGAADHLTDEEIARDADKAYGAPTAGHSLKVNFAAQR